MEILLPCPFCGDEHFSTKGNKVKCGTCGAKAPFTVWNRRQQPAVEAVALLAQFDELFVNQCKKQGLSAEQTQRELQNNSLRQAIIDSMFEVAALSTKPPPIER